MYKQFLPQNLDLPKSCGAKTRRGYPCKNAPRLPSLRCSKHGGKTPIKHGRKTKYALAIWKHGKQLQGEMKTLEKAFLKKIKNQNLQ